MHTAIEQLLDRTRGEHLFGLDEGTGTGGLRDTQAEVGRRLSKAQHAAHLQSVQYKERQLRDALQLGGGLP